MWGVWWSLVEMQFLSSLSCDGFSQHMLSYILWPRWHGRGLLISCPNPFSFLAGMGGFFSTRVEGVFMSFLACDGFGQHMLRCILCIRWHGNCLCNTCCDDFLSSLAFHMFAFRGKFCDIDAQQMLWFIYVLAGMGWVWSTHVEIYFISFLAREEFGQHVLARLVNACFDILFVSERFVQYKYRKLCVRYILSSMDCEGWDQHMLR